VAGIALWLAQPAHQLAYSFGVDDQAEHREFGDFGRIAGQKCTTNKRCAASGYGRRLITSGDFEIKNSVHRVFVLVLLRPCMRVT
jgi:hypothetical protein